MLAMIKLLRMEQYVKNAFVFAPFIFAFQFSFIDFIKVVEVFILFCALASSSYIFNDYLDINVDREHPEKKIVH